MDARDFRSIGRGGAADDEAVLADQAITWADGLRQLLDDLDQLFLGRDIGRGI